MLKSLKTSLDFKKIGKQTLSIALKVFVLLLFLFMFIGRLNPARVSKKINPKTSLVKSAFYFKSYAENIVSELSSLDSQLLENPFAATGEEINYDDYYANLASMFAENAANEAALESENTEEFDDFDELTFDKAEKIKIQKFKTIWSDFKEEHQEVASAIEYGRFASICTFITFLIVLSGVYFSWSKGKIKKIGYLISTGGAILFIISLVNFFVAYIKMDQVSEAIDLQVIYPYAAICYGIFAVLVIVCSLLLLKFEKSEADSSDFKSLFSVTPFQNTYRVLALLLFILLFIPAANPTRISENINRNVSLFTTAVSYGTYSSNLQRAIIRGWIPESVIRLSWISGVFACLGILVIGVAACMSVGNNKLKRIAHYMLLGGSGISIISLFGVLRAYNLISSSSNIDRLIPLEPNSIVLYFILLLIILVFSVISFMVTPSPEKDEKCHIDAPYQLFLMILPFLILVFIFSYLPLWGWRYAFFDYSAGDVLSMENWVGLKWFKAPFENAATRTDIIRVLRNTLAMSGLGILTSWCPMIFAVFLSEIKNSAARRVIQTLTTIPNFISWVLVYAIAFCIFGTEGFVSSMLQKAGIWNHGKNMLMGDHFIWVKMLLWGMWKGLGWSAIMYIAAISGIDQQLYEAATVDGATRMQRIWHITLPELIPTYIVLLILSISNILSNGMDQYLVFKNSTNAKPIEVLDLYVYQLTFGSASSGNIPFSTVVSMFKSLVSVVLLFITNRISKWVRGTSIF